jgi:hypothetical protein
MRHPRRSIDQRLQIPLGASDRKIFQRAAPDLVAWRLCEACLDVEAASIMLFE